MFEAGQALEADEFLDRVQQLAGLDSQTAAQNATIAVLHMLGGRITEREAVDLATYLPKEFADAMTEFSAHPR
ncbi:DUF2267 domain-containing protein [Haladaptatus halobius]|uniref:DUF2267 domain-containing protein n=1 Tax=Haladaptatus halobius TaxID=2884875 RepID=UPI002104166C|nr:DUF2267 domain-containing protein [Haladaptatus halobius]